MSERVFQERIALERLSQAVTSGVPFQNVLDLVAGQAMGLLDADAAILFLSDADGTLALRAAAGLDEVELSAGAIERFLATVRVEKEAVRISAGGGSAMDALFAGVPLWRSGSMICVPLASRENNAGAVCALSRRDGATFSEADIESLTFLAVWSAIALDGVRVASERQTMLDEKAEFVSLVAHELKVPMTSIKGYAKLLGLGTVGELSDAQKQFLDTITRNVTRMDRLVSILLDISRLDAGRVNLDMQLLSVKGLVEEAVQKSESRIKEKALGFRVEFSPDTPLIHADPTRMVQILDSLLGNATLYTPDEGTVSVLVHSPASSFLLPPGETMQYVEIEVCDTGVGIAEEDHPKVFNQFFRGDHPLVQEAAGSGFSLMATKGLVNLHRGRIGFTSQLGQGSRFVVVVPVASADGKR